MPDSIKNIKNNTLFSKIKNKQNVLIFFIALLLATLMWFIWCMKFQVCNVFEIKYTIKNLPNNYYFDIEENNKLNFYVSSNGFNIMLASFIAKYTIELDFKELSLHYVNDTSNLMYFNSKDVLNYTKSYFNNNIIIDSISPSKIYFYEKASRYSKKLAVKFDAKYSIDDDYIQTDRIKFLNNSDSVEVKGPKEILDKMFYVKTKNIDLGKISDSEPINIELVQNCDITYSFSSATIYFQLENYTETSKEIDIELKNFPQKTNVSIIPNKVKIFYKVPLSLFNIDKENFIAYVDYNKKTSEDRIFIEVVSKNKNIILKDRYIPDYVRFHIENK